MVQRSLWQQVATDFLTLFYSLPCAQLPGGLPCAMSAESWASASARAWHAALVGSESRLERQQGGPTSKKQGAHEVLGVT